MTALKQWEVTFVRDRLLGLWSWTARRNNRIAGSSWQVSITKEAAEDDAARFIRLWEGRENVNGDELLARVEARRQ